MILPLDIPTYGPGRFKLHIAAASMPYLDRMIVQSIEYPVFLASGIVSYHGLAHAVGQHDVFDVLPVSSAKFVVSHGRVADGVPVGDVIGIGGMPVVQRHPDVIVADDPGVGGNVLPDPGNLLLLQVRQRQVIDVGRLQLALLAVGQQISPGREQQQGRAYCGDGGAGVANAESAAAPCPRPGRCTSRTWGSAVSRRSRGARCRGPGRRRSRRRACPRSGDRDPAVAHATRGAGRSAMAAVPAAIRNRVFWQPHDVEKASVGEQRPLVAVKLVPHLIEQ